MCITTTNRSTTLTERTKEHIQELNPSRQVVIKLMQFVLNIYQYPGNIFKIYSRNSEGTFQNF